MGCNLIFPLAFFKIFFLSFIFWSLSITCLCIVFCYFKKYLSCRVFSESPGSVVWCLTLILGNSPWLLFKRSCVPLSLAFLSRIPIWTPLAVVPVLGYSVMFFSVFFSLIFSFGSFYCHILKRRDPFFSHVQVLKSFFISATMFFIYSISFL